MPALRIGEILITEGVLTEAAVNRALGYQRVSGERVKLGTILLNWDLLAEEGLLQALARFHRVEPVPWSVLSAAPIQVTRLISSAMAIRLGAFPFAETKTAIRVAFVEPSNLAAADEVSAVTNKRVIPAIALEIRLLQAHHKFYGRHIPLEYRSIVEKLERRTTKTKLPDWQKTLDFRLPDLDDAEKTDGRPVPPPPPGTRNPPMDLGRVPLELGPGRPGSTSIRVSRGLADTEVDRDAVPTIDIPEMQKLNPPPAADRLSDTHPVGPAPPALKPASPDKALPEDDTLPRDAAALLASRDWVEDMWRPAAEESPADEAAVSRMWTPPAAEIEASIGEARTREEIGQVALETFLVKLPRVVLFGCGKSAVTGWQGRGEAVTAEFVSSLCIPLSEDTVFASILASGVPHFGPLEQVRWPPELAERLGERAPDCAVFPIRILDGIAAFLYADRLGEPMHYEDFAIVAGASAATANALARFLLRRNSAAPVV